MYFLPIICFPKGNKENQGKYLSSISWRKNVKIFIDKPVCLRLSFHFFFSNQPNLYAQLLNTSFRQIYVNYLISWSSTSHTVTVGPNMDVCFCEPHGPPPHHCEETLVTTSCGCNQTSFINHSSQLKKIPQENCDSTETTQIIK